MTADCEPRDAIEHAGEDLLRDVELKVDPHHRCHHRRAQLVTVIRDFHTILLAEKVAKMVDHRQIMGDTEIRWVSRKRHR